MAVTGEQAARAAPPPRRSNGARWSFRQTLAIAAAIAVCAAPAIAVLVMAWLDPNPFSDPLRVSKLLEAAGGTALLVLVGGGIATILGAAAALLVSLCQFPGRSAFEWMLALPLAAPVYVLAYAYTALTWAGGPIPFPLYGSVGAAFVYALGFFPYVYLAARAAFASQSVCAIEAARSLGASPMRAFARVALPLARPGIAAGAALVAMEIAADFGAADHFGVSTITTEIMRAQRSYGDVGLSYQMATILLFAAIAFLWIERGSRGRRSFAGGSARWRPLPRYRLPPAMAALAVLLCAALVLFGALLPLTWLTRLMLLRPANDFVALLDPLGASLLLAAIGAALTLALAALVASAARHGGWVGKIASFVAAAGYAAPGVVIALGALSIFGAARSLGWVGGLGTAMALTLLIWTYAARFAATGAQPIEAGMARVTANVAGAARSLGATPMRRLFAVELPIAAPSILAAALIVFIEILKELPATYLLSPIDFQTLAMQAHRYASDERLTEAAAPALLLTFAGLIPILFLSRQISRARAGAR